MRIGEGFPAHEPVHEQPKIKNLNEALPFLNQALSEEDKNFNAQLRKAADLLEAGKIEESIALSQSLRGKKTQTEDIEFTEEQEKAFEETRGKIAEQLGYTVKSNHDKSFILEKDGYNIDISHFMIPSVFGVSGGRMSEIEISNDDDYALWDNGWNDEPVSDKVKKMFDELVEHLN